MVHDNIICAIAGLFRRMPKLNPESDIYIGYLPLAHVLELTCELCTLIMSIPIGFSNPQTLTDTSTRIKKGACQGDINVLKPTLFATVPVVLDRIAKAVWEKVKEGGPLLEAVSSTRLIFMSPEFLINTFSVRLAEALLCVQMAGWATKIPLLESRVRSNLATRHQWA